MSTNINVTREDTVNLTAIDWESIEMQAMQQEQENFDFWQEEEGIVLEVEEKKEIIPFTSLLPSSKSMSVTEFLGEEPSDEEVQLQQELASLQELADGIDINHKLTKLEERLSRGSTCYISREDACVAMKHNKGRFCALANKYKNTFRVSLDVGSVAAVAAIGTLTPKASSTQTKERTAMTLFKVVDKEINHLLKYNPYKVVSLIERMISDVGLAYLTLEQAEALMSHQDCAAALCMLLVEQHENNHAVQVILPSGQTQSMRYLFWA